ncbi:hypothetical protein P3T27_005790 [Kitasatospora sp. MAA19]|uniref:hypothetical protein n=1 Tax=Kitasatospora sp. MAA19 TaxID=3035090 RepID=UPI00247410E7|nr:hypothetical protein [Kitasatospora sp. MAA19]MDH6709044.1 hypothetical protein [Kitasatospora sp. MAA19]
MRIPRQLVAPAFGCLTLAGAVAAAPATSAALRPLPVPDVRYCAAILGHVPGADGRSPALGHACSPASPADALAHADGVAAGAARPAEQSADRTLLPEEFEDAVRELQVFHN